MEEGLVEDLHDRAHLVGGLRQGGAQRGGAAEDVDLLQHPAQRGAPLLVADGSVVVAVEVVPDPVQRRRHRPAPGLRRVGREDGVDAQVPHPRRQLAQGRHRGPHVRRGLPGARVRPAEQAGAVPLLGQVDEVEVHGERLRQARRRRGGQALDDEGRRLGVPAVCGPRRGLLKAVHERGELAAAGLGEHLTVQVRQQGDVRHQERVGGGVDGGQGFTGHERAFRSRSPTPRIIQHRARDRHSR